MWPSQDGFYDKDLFECIADNMPLKKLGNPRDFANAVVFVAANELAGHITGQGLSVSGGHSMVG